MNTEISAAALNRAAAVARELFTHAPPVALRELLEAVLGLRAARIQVSGKSLGTIRDLASRHGFGMAEAAYGLLLRRNPSMGDWSDSEGTIVDREHPDALVNIYLGVDFDTALRAKTAEEEFDDEMFGKMLGIPACCRRSYDRWMSEGRGPEVLPWLPVEATPPQSRIPAGAMYFGRYFGHGLVSHFPCNLLCAETRQGSRERLEILESLHSAFACSLALTHYWCFLLVTGKTIAAFPSTGRSGDGSSIDLQNGIALDGTSLPTRLTVVTASDQLLFSHPIFGMEKALLHEARLVTPTISW